MLDEPLRAARRGWLRALGSAPRAAFACLFVLLSACRGGAVKEGLIAPVLRDFGFPSQAQDGGVYARAVFEANSERRLGVDMVEEAGVLPIFLQVRKESRLDQKTIILSDELLAPRLFLPDGTVLYAQTLDHILGKLDPKAADRVLRNSFRGDILGFDVPIEGYLYFALGPEEEIILNGSIFTHVDGDVQRGMRVSGSLLTFTVAIDGRSRPLYIGLRP